MNLNVVVSSVISAVNPRIPVGIRISVGSTTKPDGTPIPAYATPGTITASVADSVLTVTAIGVGVLQPGQTLADTTSALIPGTMITGQLTGTPGGIGTYALNNSQTVASETMTTGMQLIAQVQPLSTRDLRQVEGLNLQGTLKGIYLNGEISGVVRVQLKGGDLITLPDDTVWLVTLVPESWNLTAGWTHGIITLQNGP